MKFIVFILMVSGVLLLALGRFSDGANAVRVESKNSNLSDKANEIVDFVSDNVPESLVQTVKEELDQIVSIEKGVKPKTESETESGSVPSVNAMTTSTGAEEVLTHGIEYSQKQLSSSDDTSAGSSSSMNDVMSQNSAKTMREIHSLNREALSSLSRVDSVLHSKRKGSKQ